MPTTLPLRRLVAIGLGTVLAACGGGGGDSQAATPSPPAPPPAAAADCGLADFQAALLARINQARAAGASCGSAGRFAPAPALAWNARLAAAATAHTQDMVTNDFFAHTGSDGSTAAMRVDAAGYAWRSVGENIAGGPGSVGTVMDGWLASPGHCANLLSPAFTEVGVACLRAGAGQTYRTYWTMNLARPR